MRIGFDLDGVLYDFAGSLRAYLVQYEGFTSDQLPDPTCWEFYEVDWGLSLKEYLEYCELGVNAGEVFSWGWPEAGAAGVIDLLRNDGHTIHIVTHRKFGRKSATNTELWLNQNNIRYDTLTFAADKTLVNVDIFIEDNVDNYLALQAAGVHAVLMDRPWNQHAPEHAKKVHDLCEFRDYILRLNSIFKAAKAATDKVQPEYVPVTTEAEQLVYGNRNADYGHPLDDFSRSSKMWSAILNTNVEPDQVALCMIAVKISRQINLPKRDNLVDIAGYAETINMVARERELRGKAQE